MKHSSHSEFLIDKYRSHQKEQLAGEGGGKSKKEISNSIPSVGFQLGDGILHPVEEEGMFGLNAICRFSLLHSKPVEASLVSSHQT
mmetsp:Transcript_113128/g.225270  ORF Transcript_113128/g.225270 Transcript_113128/m.225270 type:complete len:86 (-) Transcript_113128:662-919(-)